MAALKARSYFCELDERQLGGGITQPLAHRFVHLYVRAKMLGYNEKLKGGRGVAAMVPDIIHS